MPDHVKTIAILTARAGKAGELRALLDTMIVSSRAEPGNLRYDLWQDRTDPARFVLDELYLDVGAVEAHRASPHFRNYLTLSGRPRRASLCVLTHEGAEPRHEEVEKHPYAGG